MNTKKFDNILKKDVINDEIFKKIILYILAFLIPFITLIVIFIFLGAFPFGQNTYLPADSLPQYSNFLIYFKNFISGGDNLFYSLSKSLGGEMFGTFTYYLISPFNLIALLFDKTLITIGYDLIIALKTATAGVTFCYYLNRKKKAKFSNLIFSSMYVFSSYAITYGFNIMWLDAFILLPIVIAGLEDLLDSKKVCLYTIALSLTLITNYYMGFIVCEFVGLYFIYKLILKGLKSKKDILKTILRFIIYSLIAVLIAGIILLPSFLYIREGRADFSFSNLKFEKNYEIQNVISKFFTGAFNKEEVQNFAMPPVFCGIIANILVILFFTNKKISLKEKNLSFIFLLIFFASFYIKTFNLLWVMGNKPAWYIYRYAFCFTFIYIIIAHKSFENIKENSKTKIILASVIHILLGICVLLFNLGEFNKLFVKIDLLIILIITVLLCIYKFTYEHKKIKTTKFIVICIFLINLLDLVTNTWVSIREIKNELCILTEEDYAGYVNGVEREINKIKELDSSLYRIEQGATITQNDALVFDFNGTNFTGSTYSKELHSFLGKLGYYADHVAVVNIYENTKTIDMLFGIKYKFMRSTLENFKNYIPVKGGENETFIIYKNPHALNLGFCVPESILNKFEEKENLYETQNLLMKNISGNNENIFIKHKGKVKEELINLKEDSIIREDGESIVYNIENKEKEAKLIYKFEAQQEGDTYITFEANKQLKMIIYINDKEINIANTKDGLNILNLGKQKAGDKVRIEIKIDSEIKNYTVDNMYVYYEKNEVIEKDYEILSKNQVDLKEISSSHYEGKINTEKENTYILFTIPYDKGWKIAVDGKKINTIVMQDALMGVLIDSPGEHEITMNFVPYGFYAGVIISASGIILFIIGIKYRIIY